MYKLCKTEQSTQRQRQLEDGLLDAMLTQRYEDISISDLCEHMGVPRKTFYRYFSSKDGALHALLDHRLMEFDTRAKPVRTGMLTGAFTDLYWFFEFWHSQNSLLDALARSGLSDLLVQRAIVHSQEEQFPSFRTTQYPRDYKSHATAFAVCGLMNMAIRWHHDGYQQSPDEMAEMAYAILSRPMVQNPQQL